MYANNLDFPLLQYYQLVGRTDFDYVYPPGDDSFLFLSILHQEVKKIERCEIVAEIGSGSGIISSHLYYWLREAGKQPILAFSTDINIEACRVSQRYYEHYRLPIEVINTNVLDFIGLKPTLIVCNPPYIPTEDEQTQNQLKKLKSVIKSIKENKYSRNFDNNLISFSWAGGRDGLHVVWEILKKVTWPCTLYFVLIGDNPLELFRKRVEEMGYKYELLTVKQKYNELLHIVKIVKN